MKLNYKRTILVGFAFFLICSFWQVYDTIVPLILTNKFEMSQTMSGFVMSLDNIFALVLLPVFGTLSDKTKTPFGRRTPYIVIGTVLSAMLLSMLGFIDNLVVFVVVLLLALLSMALYRSPAVALMPDVTIKPLRSKGNAIINLMGTAGAITALIVGIIFKTGEAGKTDFGTYMVFVAGIMLLCLAVFMLTVKETKWSKEAEKESERLNCDEEAHERDEAGGKLTKGQLASLVFILSSVALWYIGYNAVTTKYSVYSEHVLKMDYGLTLIVAQAAAVIAYIPVGIISSKIGRKKAILAGVAMLFAAFFCGSFVTSSMPLGVMYIFFALGGIGWATINVNSFPMVVELAKGADCGKYTGYYYSASMAAQIITPIFSGFLMDKISMRIMFPYACVFVGLSFITMLFVKHGDSKPEKETDIMTYLAGDAD